MATEVRLPDELREVEGVTINRWLVEAGGTVKAGDPLIEVATEKVDTQIQSPADGTLLQVNFSEGELVPTGAIVALIGEAGEAAVAAPARAPEAPAESEAQDAQAAPAPAASEAEAGERSAEDGKGEAKVTPVARRVAQEEGVSLDQIKGTGTGGQVTKDDVLAYVEQRKQSADGDEPPQGQAAPAPEPAEQAAEEVDDSVANVASLTVKRMAAEYRVDLRDVAQGRPLGSLTKYDMLSYIASQDQGKPVTVEPRRAPAPEQPPTPAAPAQAPKPQARPAQAAQPAAQEAGAAPPGLKPGEEFVPHSRMRSLVARNTAQAAFSIPHVTTWWDLNVVAVMEHRKAHKAEYARAGVNLTLTAYFVQAAIAALRAVPAANSSWTDEGLILKRQYNIGIAVALPANEHGLGGLIIPVIKNAGDLNLMGIARAVNDVAERARANQLKSEDLQGGTFTITNYGTSGSRFQTPIIAGNQAGILGVGAIEKRAVVISQGHPLEANTGDHLAFLPMVTLGFSYDHRILDGATADAFCAVVKETLQNWK